MKKIALQFGLLCPRALREPNNASLFKDLLLYTEIQGNYAESIALHEAVLDAHPYAAYAWYNLGCLYQHEQDTEAVLDALEYAYIAQPRFEAAYLAYGDYAMTHGLYRRALLCYEEMSCHVDVTTEVLLRMSECHRALAGLTRAKQLCQEALKLNPYEAQAYFQLGLCSFVEQDYLPAERWFRQAVRYNDQADSQHAALARTQVVLGKQQEAVHHYHRAIELAPEVALYWLELATLQWQAADKKEALATFSQAAEHAHDIHLLYGHAACTLAAGRRTQGMRLLRKALTCDVRHHPLLFEWAPALQHDEEVWTAIRKRLQKKGGTT